MKGKYLKLVKLQEETEGVSFRMMYSPKLSKHIVLISDSYTFSSYDIEKALTLAIEYIERNREESPVPVKYTFKKELNNE